MATIQVGQEMKLEEIIIEALTRYAGTPLSIREIKKSLDHISVRNYNGSLLYSKKEFYRALEQLTQYGFYRNNFCHRLIVTIYPHVLRKPEVRFSLNIFGNTQPQSVSVQIPPQETNSEHEKSPVSVDS